jgi:hypothetical protein
MPEPVVCTACDVPRKAISLELLHERYQTVFYECPSCKSVLRLVEHRQRALKDFGKRSPKGDEPTD